MESVYVFVGAVVTGLVLVTVIAVVAAFLIQLAGHLLALALNKSSFTRDFNINQRRIGRRARLAAVVVTSPSYFYFKFGGLLIWVSPNSNAKKELVDDRAEKFATVMGNEELKESNGKGN